MMRKLLWVLLFIECCCELPAQIVFKNNPVVIGIGCKQGALGSISLTISQTHPPYTIQWSTGAITASVNNLEEGSYTVTIKDALGADTTLSFQIEKEKCKVKGALYFTPNNDGINDVWEIENAEFFDKALIVVYNRLGQIVYRFSGKYSDDKRWDGTDIIGHPLPTSSYFYVIIPDKSDKEEVKGCVSIIR